MMEEKQFPILRLDPVQIPGRTLMARELVLRYTVKVGRAVVNKAKPSHTNAIFESKVLSRSHAEIWADKGKVYIQDTKSSNGTYLDGRRLSTSGTKSDPQEMRTGMELKLGVDVTENNTAAHKCVAFRITVMHPGDSEDGDDDGRIDLHDLWIPIPALLAEGDEAIGTEIASLREMYADQQTKLTDMNKAMNEVTINEMKLSQQLKIIGSVLLEVDASAEDSYQDMLQEDKLLSRIDAMESQLEYYMTRYPSKDEEIASLRDGAVLNSNNKHDYEMRFKALLKRAHEEKAEVIERLQIMKHDRTNTLNSAETQLLKKEKEIEDAKLERIEFFKKIQDLQATAIKLTEQISEKDSQAQAAAERFDDLSELAERLRQEKDDAVAASLEVSPEEDQGTGIATPIISGTIVDLKTATVIHPDANSDVDIDNNNTTDNNTTDNNTTDSKNSNNNSDDDDKKNNNNNDDDKYDNDDNNEQDDTNENINTNTTINKNPTTNPTNTTTNTTTTTPNDNDTDNNNTDTDNNNSTNNNNSTTSTTNNTNNASTTNNNNTAADVNVANLLDEHKAMVESLTSSLDTQAGEIKARDNRIADLASEFAKASATVLEHLDTINQLQASVDKTHASAIEWEKREVSFKEEITAAQKDAKTARIEAATATSLVEAATNETKSVRDEAEVASAKFDLEMKQIQNELKQLASKQDDAIAKATATAVKEATKVSKETAGKELKEIQHKYSLAVTETSDLSHKLESLTSASSKLKEEIAKLNKQCKEATSTRETQEKKVAQLEATIVKCKADVKHGQEAAKRWKKEKADLNHKSENLVTNSKSTTKEIEALKLKLRKTDTAQAGFDVKYREQRQQIESLTQKLKQQQSAPTTPTPTAGAVTSPPANTFAVVTLVTGLCGGFAAGYAAHMQFQ